MQYEAIQIIEERIHRHEITASKLVVEPGKDDELTPSEKSAIRDERKIEDAVIEELKSLRRLMMEN